MSPYISINISGLAYLCIDLSALDLYLINIYLPPELATILFCFALEHLICNIHQVLGHLIHKCKFYVASCYNLHKTFIFNEITAANLLLVHTTFRIFHFHWYASWRIARNSLVSGT